MSDKIYQKLPAVFQTTAIKNFFESTVEQLFSKANTETAYGFLGNKTSEDLGANGVYVPEPTTDKKFYSLSPVVNNINTATGKSQDFIFFDEFLDTLRIYGVDVRDQNKLFGEHYYSYLPPIDQDKLLNYQEYFWVPGGPWRIEITGTPSAPIDIEADILGQSAFTPPGGKAFRDGMVVYFTGSHVSPAVYLNREFIVEGVGEKIFLVPNNQRIACKYATTSALPWDGTGEITDGAAVRHSSGQITQVNVIHSGNGYVDPVFRVLGTLAVDPVLGILPTTFTATVDALGEITSITVNSTPEQLYSGQISLGLELNIDETQVLAGGPYLPTSIDITYSDLGTIEINSGVNSEITGKIEGKITSIDLVNNTITIDNLKLVVDNTVITPTGPMAVPGTTTIPVFNAVNARVGQYVRGPFTATATSIVTSTSTITLSGTQPLSTLSEDNVFLATSLDIILQVLRTPDLHDITPTTFTINNTQVRLNVNPITGDYYILGGAYAFDADFDGDGIGDLPWSEEISQTVPDYILQARGAKNNNVWSRINFWFHKQNFIDAGQPVPGASVRAVRPIVEFDHRLELFNHGSRSLGSVNIAATDDSLEDISNLGTLGLIDSYPALGATFILPNEPVAVSQYVYYTIESLSGYLVPMRVPDPATNPSGAVDGDVNFVPLVIQPGDTFYITGGAVNFGAEYYFTADGFVLAQEKFRVNTPPLFNLYDDQGVYLADEGVYPSSTFSGNKIFGYAEEIGTATNAAKSLLPDSVLGFNLVYRQFKASAEILFENFIDTAQDEYFSYGANTATAIPGTKFYKIIDDEDIYHALWRETGAVNQQLVVTTYDITQIDVNNSKTTFGIGVVPQSPEQNNIQVLLNGNIVSNYTYVPDALISFATADFSAGDFIEIKVLPAQGLSTLKSASHFELPLSWDHNVLNEDLSYVSEPEYLQHFRNYIAAQATFQGDSLASNNYNSTFKQSKFARDIVKTDQDLILASLLLDDQAHNLVDALRFNAAEYQKYKNRLRNEIDQFIRFFDADNMSLDYVLEQVLRKVTSFRIGKTVYNRTYIVPYGDNYNEYSVSINDIFRTVYVSDISTDLDNIENALLVFHESTTGFKQLIADYDYVVTDYNPVTITLTGTVPISLSDRLVLRVYDGERDSAQCPPTPSTMGLYPLSMPVIEQDTTFSTPITVIVGHDGSRTPATGTIKDQILLEFELRIYNSAAKQLRDANSVYEYSKYNVKPGAYRNTGFNVAEWSDLTRFYFNAWATSAGVDQVANEFFDDTTDPTTNQFDPTTSDTWTWNYRGTNSDPAAVPGYWRGWYEYHYDTVRPDTHPWEMLGFTEQPDWWVSEYGTDYSAINTALWSDLEQGIIRQGIRANLVDDQYLVNNLFRRIGLSTKLPVDTNGHLLSPQEISPFTVEFDPVYIGAVWRFGDLAPVENAWTYTETYPFAVAEAMLLAKPGLFATQFSNPLILYRAVINPAYVFSKLTKKRWQFNSTEDFKIHGTTDSAGEFVTTLGYTQFIHSWLQYQGLNTDTDFGDKVRSLNVKIGHRMSGFIDKDTMTLRTDQYSSSGTAASLIIPKENIDIQLHASPYKTRNYYSGVIIEKTTGGYKVRGYDRSQCYFDILPSLTTGLRERVTVGGAPAAHVIWQPNLTYRMGTIVDYLGSYYKASVTISSDTFDRSVWQRLPVLPQIGGATATYYQQSTGVPARIEYEHEFDTVEETYDFIVSLGRYQESQGYDFGVFDPEISDIRNWAYAGKQFLFWTTGRWEIDNTLELSPLANKVTFHAPQGFIAKINRVDREQFTLVDQSGATIAPTACEIIRLDDYISIIPPQGQQIYGVLLYTKEIEHAMVIDNVTEFNDIIFDPIINQRHRRLKIKTRRTAGWTGKLLSEGYIIGTEELKPNLDNLAESLGRYHELGFIPVEKQIYTAARALFGYQEREYLRELDILDDEQFEFYRGMIQAKGTAEAMKMIAESRAVVNGRLDVYDEWALRVGDFGDIENEQAIELKIAKNEIVNDPQLVTLAFPEDVTGVVERIDVFQRKFKYTSVPIIEISPPYESDGIQATAVATLTPEGELGSITVTNQGSGYDYTSYAKVITGSVVTGLVNTRFQLAAAYSNAWIDVTAAAGQVISISDNTVNGITTASIDLTGITTAQDIADRINYEPTFGGDAYLQKKGNISANVYVTDLKVGSAVDLFYTLQIVGNDFTIDSAPSDLHLTTGRYQPKQRYAIETANSSIAGEDIIVKVGTSVDNLLTVPYSNTGWEFDAGDVWTNTVNHQVVAGAGVTIDVNLGTGINNGETSIAPENQVLVDGVYPYLDVYINNILVRNKTYTREVTVPYTSVTKSGSQITVATTRAVEIRAILDQGIDPGFIRIYLNDRPGIAKTNFQIDAALTTSSDLVINNTILTGVADSEFENAVFVLYSSQPTVYRVLDSNTLRINIEREALPEGILVPYVPEITVIGEPADVQWRLPQNAQIKVLEYATVDFSDYYFGDLPGNHLQILSTAPDGISIKLGVRRLYEITPDYQDDDLILIDIDDSDRFLKRPTGTREHNLWPTFSGVNHYGVIDNRYPTIPNAGYVNRDTVNFRVFDLANLPELYSKDCVIHPRGGHTIHVANAENRDWNIYELEPITASISYLMTGQQEVELYTDRSLYSYTDGNLIGDADTNRYLDNYLCIQNARISDNIVVWTAENIVQQQHVELKNISAPRMIESRIRAIRPSKVLEIENIYGVPSQTYQGVICSDNNITHNTVTISGFTNKNIRNGDMITIHSTNNGNFTGTTLMEVSNVTAQSLTINRAGTLAASNLVMRHCTRSRVALSENHNLRVGDVVRVMANNFSGVYTIEETPSIQSIVIDAYFANAAVKTGTVILPGLEIETASPHGIQPDYAENGKRIAVHFAEPSYLNRVHEVTSVTPTVITLGKCLPETLEEFEYYDVKSAIVSTSLPSITLDYKPLLTHIVVYYGHNSQVVNVEAYTVVNDFLTLTTTVTINSELLSDLPQQFIVIRELEQAGEQYPVVTTVDHNRVKVNGADIAIDQYNNIHGVTTSFNKAMNIRRVFAKQNGLSVKFLDSYNISVFNPDTNANTPLLSINNYGPYLRDTTVLPVISGAPGQLVGSLPLNYRNADLMDTEFNKGTHYTGAVRGLSIYDTDRKRSLTWDPFTSVYNVDPPMLTSAQIANVVVFNSVSGKIDLVPEYAMQFAGDISEPAEHKTPAGHVDGGPVLTTITGSAGTVYNMTSTVSYNAVVYQAFYLGYSENLTYDIYQTVQINTGLVYAVLIDRVYPTTEKHDYYATLSAYNSFKSINGFTTIGRVDSYYLNGTTIDLMAPVDIIAANSGMIQSLPAVEPAFYAGKQIISEPFALPSAVTEDTYTGGNGTDAVKNFEHLPQLAIGSYRPGNRTQIRVLSPGHNEFMLWTPGLIPGAWAPTPSGPENIKPLGYGSGYYTTGDQHQPLSTAINSTGAYPATGLDTQGWGVTLPRFMYSRDYNVYPLLNNIDPEYASDDVDSRDSKNLNFVRPDEIFVACFWTEPYLYRNQLVGFDYKNANKDGNPSPIYQDYQGTIVRVKYIRLTELPPNACLRRPIPDTGWGGIGWRNLITDSVAGLLTVGNEEELWNLFAPTQIAGAGTDEDNRNAVVTSGSPIKNICPTPAGDRITLGEISDRVPLVGTTSDPYMVLNGSVLSRLPLPNSNVPIHYEYNNDLYSVRGQREYKFAANWKWTSADVANVGIPSYKKFDFHNFKVAGNDYFKVAFDFSNPKLTAAGVMVVQSDVPYAYDYDPYAARDSASNVHRTAEEAYWDNAVFVEGLSTRSDGFVSSNDGTQVRDYGNQLMRNGRMYEETGTNKTALQAFGITTTQAEQTTAPYALNKANSALANTTFIKNVNVTYGDYDLGVQGVGFIEGTIDQSRGQYVTVFVNYGSGSTTSAYGLFVSAMTAEVPIMASQTRDSSTLADSKPSTSYSEGAEVQLFTYKSSTDKSLGYFCNTNTIFNMEVEVPNVYYPYHSVRGSNEVLVPGKITASSDLYISGGMPARTLVKSLSLAEFDQPGSLPQYSTVEVKGYYKALSTGTHYFRFRTTNAEAYAWINTLGYDDLSGAELYKQDGYVNGTNYTVENATLKVTDTWVSVTLEQDKYYFIRGIFGTRYTDSFLRLEHSDDAKIWSAVTFTGRAPNVTEGVDTPLMLGTRAQLAPTAMLSPLARATTVQPRDLLPTNRYVNTSVQRITGGYIVPLATQALNPRRNNKPFINLNPDITTNNILRNDIITAPRAIDSKVNLSGQVVSNTKAAKSVVVAKTHAVESQERAPAPTDLTDIVYSNTPTINITPLARVALDQYQAARPTIKVPVYRPTPGVLVSSAAIANIKPNSEIIINGRAILLRNNTLAEMLGQINRAGAGVMAFRDVSSDSVYVQSLTEAAITFKNGRAGSNLFKVNAVNPSSAKLGTGYRIGDRLRLVGGRPVKVNSGAIVNIKVLEAGAGYSVATDISIVIESDVGYGAIARVARLDDFGGIADIEILREGIGYDANRPTRIRLISATGNPQAQAVLSLEIGDAMADNQLARVAKFIVTGVDNNGAVTSLKTIDPGLYEQLPSNGAEVALEYDFVVTGSLLGAVDPSNGFLPYGQGHPDYAQLPFVNGKHPDWAGYEEYKLDPLTGAQIAYTGTPGALDPDTYCRLAGTSAALKRKEYDIVLGTGAYVSPLAMPGGVELMVTMNSESVFSGDERSRVVEDLGLPEEVLDLNIARHLSSWINLTLERYGVDVDEVLTRVVKTGTGISALEIDTGYPALHLDSDTPEFLEMLGIPSGTYSPNILTLSSVLSTPDFRASAKDQNKISDILGASTFESVDVGASDIISILDARTLRADTNSVFGFSEASFYSQLYRYTLRNMNKQPLRVNQTQGKQNASVFVFKSLRYNTEQSVTGRLQNHRQLWIDDYQNTGWAYLENGQVVYRQEPLVDVKYIENTIIYDQDSGVRELDLLQWDPFKGVLPGFIQREIDFISEVDPVTYNTARTDFGRKNIGKVWWDTSTVKYEWYEQGTNRERWQRWGAMFPGSTITVCEWVESKALPQNWNGEGRPRWVDRYITERHIDPETGKHIQYYYYWVQNRSTLTERTKELAGRLLDTQTIARYIGNPVGLGVSMISFVSPTSFVLSNIAEVLREDDNIIQINFSRNLNPDGIKHTAWKLMREGDNNSVIPDYLTLKLIDSLAGENAIGQAVPDPLLSEVERYGIQFRPRQSMFKNVKEARRTLAAMLNSIFEDLKLETNHPFWDTGLPATMTYFNRVNWYEVERIDESTKTKVRYNSNYKPVFSVGSKAELAAYTDIPDGTVVQVKQTAASRPQLYMFVADINEFKLISIFADTLRVHSSLYTDDTNTVMSQEIRTVLTALINNVFVNTAYWNQIFFEMLKYAYMEQEQLNWAFKTTYLYVEKEEQDLVQFNGFKPDNFEKILSYLNEVKPFSAKIRDYKDGKTAPVELIGGTSIDDYDKPIYIDYVTGEQRMLDDNNPADLAIMQSLPEYQRHASSQNKDQIPFRHVVNTLYFDRTNWQFTAWGWDSSTTPELLSVARNMARINAMTTAEIGSDPTIRAIDRIFKSNPVVRTEFETSISNYLLNLEGGWDPRLLTGLYITKPLALTSVEIEVNNIHLLPVLNPETPNTIYVGDEIIRYRLVEGNTLKQVVRGVSYTEAQEWPAGEAVWAGNLQPWETTSWDRSVLLSRYADGLMTPGTDPLIITDTYKLYALLLAGVLDRTLALLKTYVGGDFRGEYIDSRYFADGVPGYDSDIDVFSFHGYTSMGWDTHVLDTYQIVQNYTGTFDETAINFIRDNVLYNGFDGATFKRLYGEERPEEMVKLDPLESMIMRVTTGTTAIETQGFEAVIDLSGGIVDITYNTSSIVSRSYGIETGIINITGSGVGAQATINVDNNQISGTPTVITPGTGYTPGNVQVTLIASLASTAQNVTYQIHHNMFGGTQYLRLLDRGVAANSNISMYDHEIEVKYNYGGYELPDPQPGQPGIIWIDSECVQYHSKSGNILRDVRRGVAGTTAESHSANTTIWLGTTSEILRNEVDPERANWLETGATYSANDWGSFIWGVVPWGTTSTITLGGARSLADRERANIADQTSIMRFLHYPDL